MNTLVDFSKSTWLKNKPTDWSIGTVKHLFDLSKEKNVGEELPVLSLTQKGIKIRDISSLEGQLAETYENYTRIRKEDIVFNPMDLRTGYVGLSDFEGVISLAYTVIRRKRNVDIDLNYYSYFFQWHYLQEIFFPFGQGVSPDHRWTLKDYILMNFPVLIPPLKVQEGIAHYLDNKTKAIEKLIKKQKKLIELLHEKRKALITNTVTRGLKENIDMKDSEIEWLNMIPKTWKIKKLKWVAKIKTGTTPSTQRSDYFDGDIPWYSPGDFSDKLILSNPSKFITQIAIEENAARVFDQNSVFVVGIGGTTGKAGLIEQLSSSNQQINAITFKADINPLYGAYFFKAFEDVVYSTAPYSTLPIMDQKRTGDLFILVPKMEEQESIIKFLNEATAEIDAMVQNIKFQIAKINEYRLSLIHAAVTGKIKI